MAIHSISQICSVRKQFRIRTNILLDECEKQREQRLTGKDSRSGERVGAKGAAPGV